MIRGEIYRADLGQPVGREQSLTRPVLVVSAQDWLNSVPTVVATLPLTRTRRGRPSHVEVEPHESGLREVSYIRCEDIRAISTERFGHRLGKVDELVLFRVDVMVRRLLGL